jgi:hypothetical protein
MSMITCEEKRAHTSSSSNAKRNESIINSPNNSKSSPRHHQMPKAVFQISLLAPIKPRLNFNIIHILETRRYDLLHKSAGIPIGLVLTISIISSCAIVCCTLLQETSEMSRNRYQNELSLYRTEIHRGMDKNLVILDCISDHLAYFVP